eukprot:scaffold527226_cov42-Prasinocladus_malaysianus.AAC.1
MCKNTAPDHDGRFMEDECQSRWLLNLFQRSAQRTSKGRDCGARRYLCHAAFPNGVEGLAVIPIAPQGHVERPHEALHRGSTVTLKHKAGPGVARPL